MKGGSFFGLGKSAAPIKSVEQQAKEFAAQRYSSPDLFNSTIEETGNRSERDLVQGLLGKTGTMPERYEALKTEWAGMKKGSNSFQMRNINPFSAGGKRYRKSRKSRKSRKTKGGKKSKKSKKTRKTRRKSRKH